MRLTWPISYCGTAFFYKRALATKVSFGDVKIMSWNRFSRVYAQLFIREIGREQAIHQCQPTMMVSLVPAAVSLPGLLYGSRGWFLHQG